MRKSRKPLKKLERGLPASWYRDPAHYARELEAFWYGRWIAACREEEFPGPGNWRVIRIGTQQILVCRNENRELKAFHNTCRHRGSILCTAESGKFARERIVCPYHSWTYDLAGRLVATPRRMETTDFDMAKFPLYAVHLKCWGGFAFVCLSSRPPDFEPPVQFKNYGLENLRIGKRIVTDIKANWKLLAENFSECFHCPPVHPELCRIVTAYREAGAWGLRGKESKPEYQPGATTLTMDGSSRIPPFGKL